MAKPIKFFMDNQNTQANNNQNLTQGVYVNPEAKKADITETKNAPPPTSAFPEKTAELEATITAARSEREEEETKKKAIAMNVPYVFLTGFPISSEVLFSIPEEEAEKLNIIPYLKIGQSLRVATIDPISEEIKNALRELGKKLKLSIKAILCSRSSLTYGYSLYKTTPHPFEKKSSEEVAVSEEEKEVFKKGIQSLGDIKESIKKVSTTRMLELVLAGAGATHASDIHIAPKKNGARLRYRIDGVLHDAAAITDSDYKQLNSRIKYLAKLKIDVTAVPQDGRFSIEIAGMAVDLRVSALPTLYGESIVMRLLEQEKEVTTLESLGFNKEVLNLIEEAIKKPNGMILNTGPTGSGKTTTLYAMLSKLNQPEVKIVTLEDPVEYKITGVTQTPIDPYHDFGFAKALRASLRQDPDIIMVGEIRDTDTATIALHAALTGHLVITTLHTNNAPAAIIRLIDMKIRPFLLVGSVNLTIAQRLVRKICPECKAPHTPARNEEEILKRYLKKKNLEGIKLYEGKGCPACNNTGFQGRNPIAEAFVPNENVEDLILSHATQKEMITAVKRNGMKTMFEDGLDKVLGGMTTIPEILRVTAEY